jgi:hypothetical protein
MFPHGNLQLIGARARSAVRRAAVSPRRGKVRRPKRIVVLGLGPFRAASVPNSTDANRREESPVVESSSADEVPKRRSTRVEHPMPASGQKKK